MIDMNDRRRLNDDGRCYIDPLSLNLRVYGLGHESCLCLTIYGLGNEPWSGLRVYGLGKESCMGLNPGPEIAMRAHPGARGELPLREKSSG
jgi:hypothetical protein